MGKKKAIKLATATAIAASAFVAVAPTQSEAATSSVDKAITKATNQMAKAYDTYHKAAKNEKTLPKTATIRNEVKLANDYYAAATKEIAKNGGSKTQKAAYTKKLEAKKYFLDRAEAYLAAVNTNLNPAKNAFNEAVKGGKQKTVLAAQNAYNEAIKGFEAKVDKIYGPDARDLLKEKYAAPAHKLADSVNDEMKVYNAYKDIEQKDLIEKDLEAAYKEIDGAKDAAAKIAKLDTTLAKNITKAVEKNITEFEKAVKAAVSIEGITDGEKTDEETKTITVKATKGSEIKVTLNGTAVAANENGSYTLKLQDGSNKVAVESTVYGVKTELNKEITSNQTPVVKSVSAINSKSLKVEFSKAVDDTKAVFEVKKDGFKVNSSTITFSADKKSATVELTSKITKGEYAVSVTGLTKEAITGSVTTQDETVSNVEILSEIAPLSSDAKSATVGYKVLNQYGEDITKLTSLEKSAGGATAEVDGLGKITLKPVGTTFKEGDKVVVTLIHPSTAKSVTKTITISAQTKVSDVTFGNLYNKDGKTINEDTDLSKDLFYLPVTVKDQYENAVTDVKRLNGLTSEVLLNNANPTVVDFGAFEVIKINNVDTVVLPVKGVKENKATVGETFVTVIAKSNGKPAQTSVKVTEAVRSDAVNLQAPTALVVENEDILFPLSITDKEGKAITDVKVANDGVKGVKVTSGNGTIVTVDGALFVKVPKTSVKENAPITVVVQSSTNKVATQTVIPKAIVAPKVITGTTLTTQSVRPGKSLSVTYDKLKIEDQYGRLMSKEAVADALKAGYSIKADAGENKNLTLDGTSIAKTADEIKVVAKSGVTTKVSENITFTLVAPKDGELKTSAFDTKFNLVPNTEFVSYEVADLGTVYLANGEVASGYEKDIVVKAITKDGQKVTLDKGVDYTVKSTTLKNLDDSKIDTKDAEGVTYAPNTTTASAKVTVTINESGQEFVKDVNFSNVAPQATKVELVEEALGQEYIDGEDVKVVTDKAFDKEAAFNLNELEKLADIVVTDQYGVSVLLDEETEVATFVKGAKSIATSAATLTLTKVSGDVTFASNGTTTASVNEVTAGATFNARVNVSGVAATPAKITAKKAYSNTGALTVAEKKLDEATTAEGVAKKNFDEATTAEGVAKTNFDEATTAEGVAKTNFDEATTAEGVAKTNFDKATTAEGLAKKAQDDAKEAGGDGTAEQGALDSAKAETEKASDALDSAKAETKKAKDALDSAKAETEKASDALDSAKAETKKAKDALDSAKAETKKAQDALDALKA
ncbi:hypothetical protein ACIQZM_09040 [Peribacillus sp. NPDC097206]|uniref:hypothetical protein n=1 Tax=Peribacillus sp. NPDC097206 TaxID=3364398 RepID=UPI00380AC1C0